MFPSSYHISPNERPSVYFKHTMLQMMGMLRMFFRPVNSSGITGETHGFDFILPVSQLVYMFSRLIFAKSSHIFRTFPYNILVYTRLYARTEDHSMTILMLRIIMKVLFVLLFMIIFVVIYLPSTIFSIIYIHLVNFSYLPVYGQISLFFLTEKSEIYTFWNSRLTGFDFDDGDDDVEVPIFVQTD